MYDRTRLRFTSHPTHLGCDEKSDITCFQRYTFDGGLVYFFKNYYKYHLMPSKLRTRKGSKSHTRMSKGPRTRMSRGSRTRSHRSGAGRRYGSSSSRPSVINFQKIVSYNKDLIRYPEEHKDEVNNWLSTEKFGEDHTSSRTPPGYRDLMLTATKDDIFLKAYGKIIEPGKFSCTQSDNGDMYCTHESEGDDMIVKRVKQKRDYPDATR